LTCYQFESVTATPPEGCYGDIFNHPNFGVYDYCACPPGGCPDDCFDDPSPEVTGGKVYTDRCVPGHNNFPAQLNIGSQEACYEFCKNEPSCKTADYLKGKCYASKAGYDASKHYPKCDMWVKNTGIELYGDEVNNNPTGPLQECEGDCDNDTTCGGCLTCYQFESVTATPPEGCYGDIFNHPKFGVYDYCACPPGGCPDDCFGPVAITAPRSVTPKSVTPPTKSKASGSGDPHFKTWTGDKYDYHGECDLVLIDNPSFENGLGLRLHIRTTRVKYFSFIEKVALQIGNDTLEFDNDVENFLINGAVVEANRKHHKTMLGNFFVRRDTKAISVRLHNKEGKAKIDFHTRKNGFPAVIVDGANSTMFQGSRGLLGEWGTGKRLSREGFSEMKDEDATDFALEWQVRATEPMLFSNARHPQYPSVCIPPAKISNRLGGSAMEKEAKEACAHWKEDKDDCVFDVMATRDVLVAAEGHIVHVE